MSVDPLNDETREQLVAYLDGELADSESAAIESRLATDETLRAEMQGLDRVWNALDDLPRVTVGDAFAKSTIEMVAVEAERDVLAKTAALPIQRRRRNYALLGACVGAALLGFALVRSAGTRPDRMLLANLPVIYQVDALQNAGEIDFLRRLPKAAPSLLATAEASDIEESARAWEAIAAGDEPSRRGWVAALSENEKARLHDSARRYTRDLTPGRQEAVADLSRELLAAQDRATLLRTTLAYDAWMSQQTASEQAQLRKLPTDERLEELAKLDRRIVAQTGRSLPEADSAALRAAVVGLKDSAELRRLGQEVERRVERMAAAWRRETDGTDRAARIGQMKRGITEMIARLEKVPAFSVITLAEAASPRPQRMEWLFRDDWERVRDQARQDWQVVEAKLIAALSEEARERLDQLSEDRRREQLRWWVEHAARSAFESIDIEAYFASDDLTDAERHKLLALPTDQMEAALRRMYVNRQLGGFDRLPMGPGMRGPRDRGGWGDRGPRGDRDGRPRRGP